MPLHHRAITHGATRGLAAPAKGEDRSTDDGIVVSSSASGSARGGPSMGISRGLVLRLLLSLVLVAVLVKTLNLDLGAVTHRTLSPWWLVAAVAALFAQTWLAALRWHTVLVDLGLVATRRDAYRIVLVGLFFNQALPSSIGGDAARVWQIRGLGNGGADAASSVVLDRLIALLALLPLALVGVLRLAHGVNGGHLLATFIAIAILTAAGCAALLSLHRLPSRWLVGRLYALRTISGGATRFLAKPLSVTRTLVISIVIHTSTGLIIASLARALDVHVSARDCIVLMPLVLLVITVPVSFAGWGLREGAMVVVLGRVGVPQADALALSVAFGLGIALTGAPGALLWSLGRRARRSSVAGRRAHHAQSEARP
ncbi:MAG: glycosyltransferase 2 family protein [Actinomycetota bacterium]|jgi:uncharacterized membrane protein YbhN (UPF0104 family)|nr:glycosyltransferase 2 family protein [Actinomycetota bacterium]